MSSKKIWILVGVGFVAAVFALWAESATEDDGVPVPEAFTVENLKQKMNQPEETQRLIAQYNELTEEQRAQVQKNKEQAFRQEWEDRLTEYFEASETELVAILDRHLDEIVAEEEKYEQDRQAKPKDEDDDENNSENQKRPYRDWTTQQRKAKSESGNPDDLARAMAYKTALISRAQARGINLWPGGK